MKKLLLFLVISSCFRPAYAQTTTPVAIIMNTTDFRKQFMFGFKAGLNYSNVYDSRGQEFNVDAKLGPVAGVFFCIPIDKLIGIQPELLFSERGFKATGTMLGTSYSLRRSSYFIDVPILFDLKVSEFFSILAGPQYSYLMKQKDVFTNASNSVQLVEMFNEQTIRKNTLGLTAGFDLTLKHLVVGARAGWDLLNNNGDGTSYNPRYKNAWYQLTFGYRIYRNNL